MSRSYNAHYHHDQRRQYHQIPRPKWPPNPMVEDETTSLSREYKPGRPDAWRNEARCRGSLDPLPIIIDSDSHCARPPAPVLVERRGKDHECRRSSSSSESSTPLTPDSDENNHDRRYVYIPQKGIEIPLTYDEPRNPNHDQKSRLTSPDRRRGRQGRPELETKLPELHSSREPQLERLPSPYAYTPKSSKPAGARFSGEYLLSPDAMSPGQRSTEKSAQYFEINARSSNMKERRAMSQVANSRERQVQPSQFRHASTIVYSNNGKTKAEDATPIKLTPYPVSDDESDLSPDEAYKSPHTTRLDHQLPESPRLFSMPRLEDFANRKKSTRMSPQTVLPPPRAKSAFDARGPSTPVAQPIVSGLQKVDASLSNSRLEMRHASPRGSRTTSPHASPSTTPPVVEYKNRSTSRTVSPCVTPPSSRPMSRPTSRPSSPVQLLHSRQAAGPPATAKETKSSISSASEVRSRMTSPLPSPSFQDASITAAPRIDVRSPSPANHNKSSSYDADYAQKLNNGPGSLTPFILPHTSVFNAPPTGQRRRTSSNVETRPRLSIDPTSFPQVAAPNQSPRTNSRPTTPRAVSFGAQPFILPPCSRPYPVTGFDDWYHLIGRPSFSVCPSCREAVNSTGHERLFAPSLPKPFGIKTRCEFGLPWVGVAWLSRRGLDVDMIYRIADIEVHEPPCPGEREAVRQWYRVVDVETGKQVSSFDACSYCIYNLETVFPILRGVFQKSRTRRPMEERPCDLRSGSTRFPMYINHFEMIANQAKASRKPPNPFRFIELARKMAFIRECSRDNLVLDQDWYTMPQIPELTVCEECYDGVIRPAIHGGSTLASQFSSHPRSVGPADVGVSCQLYSLRMRSAFADACRQNDLARLREVAVQRQRIERELQARSGDVQRAEMDEGARAERLRELVDEWKRWE
ncbi:hypothetical protein MMC07_004079 [Pseudocyphellaria aurata]|nr:hypothetical protein [Pseudocyphellaria aurata]